MKRILIKLSGEGLSNKKENLSIDPKKISIITDQIKKIKDENYQISLVVGGGNFWRGAQKELSNQITRNRSDYIGMLSTIMNGLVIQSSLEKKGLKATMQSSLNIDSRVSKHYVNEKTIKSLNEGKIVIFVGGIGRPFFTTDTAAALFASEIQADLILMGKNKVNGIYDSDPKVNPNAKKFDTITWDQILSKHLKVMDSTAASMAKENNINLIVFDITKEDALLKALKGKIEHTKVVQ